MANLFRAGSVQGKMKKLPPPLREDKLRREYWRLCGGPSPFALRRRAGDEGAAKQAAALIDPGGTGYVPQGDQGCHPKAWDRI